MFRLLTYRDKQGDNRPGILVDQSIYDIGEEFISVLEILNNWATTEPKLMEIGERLAQHPNATGTPINEVTLAPPILFPGALYCAGANYADHVLEMSGKPPPPENTKPYFFIKSTRGTIIGANETIHLPKYSNQVDWEAEIGIVIGQEARNVSEVDAMDFVAGFTIVNDLSARDYTKRYDVPFLFDWIGQKCFDTGCPMGPWITPKSAIDDPHNLGIKLMVNNEVKQNSSSKEMIFKCEHQIAYLSQHVTLYPGDVIATGTPAGCGMPQKDFLKPGDIVTIEIDGLGVLSNPVHSS
jgi:2-keto-4-pentenoate hydratase/2-oxohepta-3-ene-1,7-dioic acid hydratase in catechol pathway